ncbi:major facilitator superfamily domain-containing protein [Amylocarpus encephaloides]|uniref:Major facilitator superfamily domain-containing protein n=1 Tax=Amylocarpus encephaloides TaxID=45428 RepID=A0A9P7YLC8_9HELO|nr:major facilitator superfamily domain-containing protein [Amylocarpus encephaloides]
MMPVGAGIVTSINIGNTLGAKEGEAAWLAAAYPMTQGAFVLIGGRFGDVFGYKKILLGGALWWTIFSLANGFLESLLTVSLFRGLTGIGAAFVTPNAVALLMHTFPPGNWRNTAMGLFGAMAPVGAAGGSVIAALFVQLTEWKWVFFFFAIVGAVEIAAVLILVPGAEPSDKGGRIDWIGAYLGVTGLILFNFVWNQAPMVGWQNPYEYTLLIVALLHFTAFAVWEAKFASSPILPFDIWTAPSMLPLVIVVVFAFMSFGIFIWYYCAWNLLIRNNTMLLTAAKVQPFTIAGVIAAFSAGALISRIAAQWIIAIGASAMLIASALIATMPEQQLFWKAEFFAVLFASFCPDFIFTAAQIIASNSVPRNQQGIAGSLIGTLLTYGVSTGLGFGGTVEVHTNDGGRNLVRGYRGALYLGIGFAAASLVLGLGFVRIKRDEREGWDEQDLGVKEEVDTPPDGVVEGGKDESV